MSQILMGFSVVKEILLQCWLVHCLQL